MVSLDRKYSSGPGSFSAAIEYLTEEEEGLALEMGGRSLRKEGSDGADSAVGYISAAAASASRRSPTAVLFDTAHGKAASILKLTSMNRQQLRWAWKGAWPGMNTCKTGSRASKRDPNVRETGVRNAAFDISFAGPKSLSLYLIACDDADRRSEVISAFNRAVAVAMKSVEDHALLARVSTADKPDGPRMTKDGRVSKMEGGSTRRTTASLLWVSANQWVARPTKEAIDRGYHADPHFHQHVLLMSMGLVPDPSEPSGYKALTIDGFGLKRHAAERDNIFMSELARECEALGMALDYSVGRNGKVSWEVKGANKAAAEYFSTNSAAAKKLERSLEKKLGRKIAPHEVRDALKDARRQKDDQAKELDKALNRQVYLDALEDAGLDPGDFDFYSEPQEAVVLTVKEAKLLERLDADDGLCLANATVTESEIFPAMARVNVGIGLTLTELQHLHTRYKDTLEVIKLPDGTSEFTTARQLKKELDLEAAIDTKLSSPALSVPREVLFAALTKMRTPLNQEQKNAALDISGSAGISVLIGVAGAGKSTSLEANAIAWRSIANDGLPYADKIIVLSTANNAANELNEKIGADWATSIDKWAWSLENGRAERARPTARSVVIIDEAAMTDNEHIAKVLHLAGDAKIVVVGDDEQQTAIGIAGWWQRLLRRTNPSALHTTHRHESSEDARAFADLRDGDTDRAIDNLRDRGRFHVSEDVEGRISELMSGYSALLKEGQLVKSIRMIVDSSNTQIDVLNRFAQYELQKRGLISERGFAVHQFDQDRDWTLHENDQVVFLTRYRDRGQAEVNNGQKGTIIKLDVDTGVAGVRLDDGVEVTVRLKDQEDHQVLGLAYAQHTAKFQGGKADFVLYCPGDAGVSTKNSAYSSLTRVVKQVHIYLDRVTHGDDPLDTLRIAWSKSAIKTPLLDKIELGSPSTYESLTKKAARSKDFLADAGTAVRNRRLVHIYGILSEVRGTEFAKSIVNSPLYASLDAELRAFGKLGEDEDAQLSKALVRDFGDARSAPAVLRFRLRAARSTLETELSQQGLEQIRMLAPVVETAQQSTQQMNLGFFDDPLPEEPLSQEDLELLPNDHYAEVQEMSLFEYGPTNQADGGRS